MTHSGGGFSPPPLGTQNIGYTYGDVNQGQMPDQIYKVSWNGQEKINYTYDGLGRLTNKSVILSASEESQPPLLNNQYTYIDVGTDKTTTLVQSVQTAAGTYTYTYDAVGNILSVSDGTYTNSYVYDSLNQLVRENNQRFGKTYTYAYTNGNITERKEYAYTTGELGAPQYVYNWSYGDGTWSDLLTAWNEGAASSANASSASAFSLQNTATSDETAQSFFKRALQRSSANSNVSRAARTASTADTTNTTPSFSYDEIGNPTEIFGLQFSWNGRQLTSVTVPDDPYVSRVDFGYNMDGQRISRTFTAPDGTVKTTEYFYNGENLAGEKTGDRTVVYMYDNSGDIFGFTVNGRTYYYVKNAQNDVTAITDSNGTVVVYYYYDAWGEPNYTYYACNGQTLDDVQDNPILYRSYYYDIDVGFYYLNSRYYVPMFCRFLNADDDEVLFEDQDSLIENNLFAYCLNNPTNFSDPDGDIAVSSIVGAVVGGATGAVLGLLLANKLGLSGWKKGALIAAATIGGAALGAFLGPYVVKLVKMASGAIKSTARKVSRVATSALRKASNSAFKAAKNVRRFSVSKKHLLGSKGRFAKFNTSSQRVIQNLIKTALTSSAAEFHPNKNGSYYILYDFGRTIGTRGEHILKVIFDSAGNIWSAYPTK